MAASNGGAGGGPISAEASAALGEGIGLVFRRWTALQMAVENKWGGRESRAKADQLGASVLSWFCDSRGPHYFEDLVEMMDASISEWFSADFEDGSVDEVAQELLIMHEECLQSNYSSIERLRNSQVQGNGVSQSRQIAGDDDGDSDSSDDDDDTSMMDDEAAAAPEEMAVDRTRPSNPVPDAAGGLLCLLGVVEAGTKHGWGNMVVAAEGFFRALKFECYYRLYFLLWIFRDLDASLKRHTVTSLVL